MKLVPYDRNELVKNYRNTKNQKIFEEFIESGLDCVEIVDHGHSNAKCAQSCLTTSAKRFGFNIRVIVRGERVFLIKER